MRHNNYYEVQAESYFDLGVQLGEMFQNYLHASLFWLQKEDDEWDRKRDEATRYLRHSKQRFPHLVEELRGYAKGAAAPFEDVWLLCMEDELDDTEKCTTLVTNNGSLIAHNEDWDEDAKDGVCLLKKTLNDVTIFELFYRNTLGGNSISINSHGYVHAVNTLTHRDEQVGIPRNLIARWLSETSNPRDDILAMENFTRSSGYHHTFLSLDGRLWSLESSAKRQHLTRPKPPFVHTNHFLSALKKLEEDDGSCGSMERYQCATSLLKDSMKIEEMKALLSNSSEGSERSVFNQRTIARLLIDLNALQVHAWMLAEADKGWISYDLDFLG